MKPDGAAIAAHPTTSGDRMPMHVFIICLYGLVMTLPALMPGFFVPGDYPTHTLWAKHFAHAFWQGDLYPRWAFEMNAGLGSPFLFHYGPVPYYVTSFLHPLFSNDPEGWRQAAVCAVTAMLASGIAGYFWLSRITGRSGALLGALAYMCEPYHLNMVFYKLGGLGALWALVWLPLIMMATEDVVRGKRHAVLRLACWYALLVMTHLPVTLVFSMLPLAYGLALAPRGERRSRMLLVGLGMALGIGLSAVFLVPAMTTQDTLWFTTMNEDMFAYDQNFILAGSRTNERLTTPLHIEATEVVMICIALSAWLAVRVRTSGVSRRLVNFFAATAVVAFFMMTPISTPIWELVTPLQQLQFPWRFAPIVSLAVMVLLAFLVSSPGKPFAFTKLFPVALLVAAFAFFCIPAMAELTVMARSIGTVSVNRLMELLSPVSDERLIGIDRLKYEADVIEHLPRWVPRTPFVDRKYGYLAVAQLSRETPRASVVSGKGTIDVQQWGADGINLDVHGVSPVKIVIGQFYYPGWSGRLGDSGAELACGPSKPNGLLQCDVPAGNHSVTVIRTHTKPESIGIAISTLSLLIAAAVWLTGRRRATGESARTGHIPVVPVEVTEMQK